MRAPPYARMNQIEEHARSISVIPGGRLSSTPETKVVEPVNIDDVPAVQELKALDAVQRFHEEHPAVKSTPVVVEPAEPVVEVLDLDDTPSLIPEMAPTPEIKDEEEEEGPEAPFNETMTKKQLLAVAEEMGVDVEPTWTKSVILKELREALID